MIQRELTPVSRSFFLFGPRQTGKSTWLKGLELEHAWFVNLLDSQTYFRYLRGPGQFGQEVQARTRQGIEWILSGSSARKLRRGGERH